LDIKKSREFGYVDRALSSLINRALFNNEAIELGLSVSDRNVRDKILKDEAFKDDLGQFSELLFRQLISESGYTEDSYVEGTRQDLAREQMVETIRSSLIIPDVIQKSLGEYNLQERAVDYLEIDSTKEKIVRIEEELLKEHFENNKGNFMSEELRSAETLLLDAKKYAEKLTVTDEEVQLLYEERKDQLIEPEQRYLKQILLDSEDKANEIIKALKVSNNFENVAKNIAKLTDEDIDLGWNTKSELPEEIVDAVFKLKIEENSLPLKSSFGWHIVKLIDKKDRNEITYNEVKNKFKNEILLDKGKEAVYDLQDELEDLLASGNTFDEISKILSVKLIKATNINRNGLSKNGEKNKDYQDERILRTIFNQKLNEEGNIINIDKDEGLAISIVTEIVEPKQLELKNAKRQVEDELTSKLQFERAMKKAENIKKRVENGESFENVAKQLNLELKGVKPFTRILPDSSKLPIPLVSKIFESKIGDINIEQRGTNEIVVAKTVEISNDLSRDRKEIKEFSSKIKDDLTVDLLAQFSEALRKKYKITINDDVINQLN